MNRTIILGAAMLLAAAAVTARQATATAGIGPATELGQNPVRSYGGTTNNTESVLTASGGDFVITDAP